MIKIKLTKQQILFVIQAMKSGKIKTPIYIKGATFNSVFEKK